MADVELSPSGRYSLSIEQRPTKPGCWNHTVGSVSNGETQIATVNRNYSSFPFLWIEAHPNGHDYLVCGEDYQGQTVIELDTGKRRDYVPDDAKQGVGFCWVSCRFDVGSMILVADGCIWAAPYEYRFYDFADPMSGWPEIESDRWIDADQKWPVVGPDGIICCYQTESVDDDDDGREGPTASIQRFIRDGHKLVCVDEWVSDAEKARRAEREESQRRYDSAMAEYRSSDQLYLTYIELLKDTSIKPDPYEGVGVTYSSWCPHWSGNERRMCRRLLSGRSDKLAIDLEWAAKTGPIKLQIFRDGNRSETRWFDHSTQGMHAAFAAAKELSGQ